MRHIGGTSLLAIIFAGIVSCVAGAAPWFQIQPVEIPYRNVGVESMNEQFNLDIRSPVASDELFVEFTSHVPDGWFAQFCQVSSGICYFASHSITLPANGNERLQIDFFTTQGFEEVGWVDVRIHRVSDPGTFQEITYTIGHGVVLPTSRFTFTSNQVFAQANPNDTVELRGLIRSLNAFDDQLLVHVESDMPPTWFAQFCQTSTGICYFGDATISFPAMAIDTLRVDFFCFDPNPGIGNFRLRVQSAANPSVWSAIPFRVRTGEIPADAQDPGAVPGFAATVTPNPVRHAAEFRIDLTRPSAIRLDIVDIAGRSVLERVTPAMQAGRHRVAWDGADGLGRSLPSGVYFYRVSGDGEGSRGKLIIDR
jgi:hypothetical protein